MNTIEIVLRGGEIGEEGERWRGKPKIHCKHICKYHNVSSVQLFYAKFF
jgi:hypothetical protein